VCVCGVCGVCVWCGVCVCVVCVCVCNVASQPTARTQYQGTCDVQVQ